MQTGPAQMEQTANQVIETARTFNDSNLEALALAFGGSARLIQGRVSEGMAQLDEAMTMTLSGEVSDFMVVSEIFCVMLSACETSGDLTRSEHWCQAAFAYMERHQAPFLGAVCRTTYGSLLSAMGRWHDAETTLTEAIRMFESGHYALRVHAVICLADLRVHQGRRSGRRGCSTGAAAHGEGRNRHRQSHPRTGITITARPVEFAAPAHSAAAHQRIDVLQRPRRSAKRRRSIDAVSAAKPEPAFDRTGRVSRRAR
jgi:hypothetical protein